MQNIIPLPIIAMIEPIHLSCWTGLPVRRSWGGNEKCTPVSNTLTLLIPQFEKSIRIPTLSLYKEIKQSHLPTLCPLSPHKESGPDSRNRKRTGHTTVTNTVLTTKLTPLLPVSSTAEVPKTFVCSSPPFTFLFSVLLVSSRQRHSTANSFTYSNGAWSLIGASVAETVAFATWADRDLSRERS